MEKFPKNIWWLYLIVGIFTIIFGILIFLLPDFTLVYFITFFGVFAILTGIVAIIRAFITLRANKFWWVILLEGIFGIIIGAITFIFPLVTAIALLYLIAAWATIIGVWEIVYGIEYRKEIKSEVLLILSGIITIIFGGFIFTRPGAGALALVGVIAFFCIVRGITLMVLAIRIKSIPKEKVAFKKA